MITNFWWRLVKHLTKWEPRIGSLENYTVITSVPSHNTRLRMLNLGGNESLRDVSMLGELTQLDVNRWYRHMGTTASVRAIVKGNELYMINLYGVLQGGKEEI